MVYLLIFVVLSIVFYFVFNYLRKNLAKKEKESEKLVNILYEAIKFQEIKKSLEEDAIIESDNKKRRLINIGLLFALVEVIFSDRISNVSSIQIIRWFLEIARLNRFSSSELMIFRSYLFNLKKSTKQMTVYGNYLKEVKKVVSLFFNNFKEINNLEYGKDNLQLHAINVFKDDLNIVFKKFLFLKDFPLEIKDITR